MKKNNYLLLILTLITCLVISFNTKAQVYEQYTSPVKQYNLDRIFDKDTLLFNDKMLNLLFADKVGTSFGGSNDLSLQKYFFGLDNDDKSITLGFNIDSRKGEKLDKLKWIFSGALKFKATNKFATIFDGEGKFLNDNIGATYKVTLIGNGTIDFTSSSKKKRREAIDNNRKKLFDTYNKAAVKNNKEKLNNFKKEHKESREFDDDLECYDKVLKEKHNTDYEELAQKEIDYLEENKMYNFISNRWVSLEVFTPFGGLTYNITSDENTTYQENRFYNINASLSGNYMRAYSSGKSMFFKAIVNVKNNNTIMVNNLSAKKFQTSTAATNNNLIITTEDVYVTSYDEFITTSLILEPAFFFITSKFGDFGFSPAVEFNFGKYKRTNWKVGIPISLKDNEGKPTINFEFQYKNIGTFDKSVNIFGISTNFLFGNLIN
ncbi:hypothetical protein [Polaribacter sp. L3A8]|uniref:hypothetical protein n=1 Tax=Polaribacter sp. L3A8 TaxID=2686361 RepID=UPI00131AC317|nr:hypothetical protein [Polaribacter sp. L3A8]